MLHPLVIMLRSLRKDFDVMFGHEEASSSVFVLFATACKYLLNLSMQLKNSRPNNIATKRIMYCRLLWSEYMIINTILYY